MMREVDDDLFEYEQPQGRLQLLLHRTRFRWILAGVIALTFAIPFVLVHVSSLTGEDDDASNLTQIDGSDDSTDPLLWQASPQRLFASSPQNPGGKGSGSKLEYKISGADPSSLMNITETDLSRLASSCPSLTSISLSNLYLDAAEFSRSLEGCESLEEISLENVWLVGNFTRVVLPKLRKFHYVQNGGDKRDSYKSPETLKQTLFFDKVDGETWSVEKDLLNLGIEISIWKAGTRLIDVQRLKGEIYLNVKYCEPVLLNVQGTFEKLTLINCNVTSDSVGVIPSTLKYLNLRNAVQRTPTLALLTEKLTSLEEFYLWLTFHCDWPGYELYLNLSSLPSTLKALGTNNVDTLCEPGLPSTSVKELTVGDYFTPKTVSEFPTLFKDLQRINIVNISDPSPASGYALVSQAIQMGVKTIAVVNLHRNYSVATLNEKEVLEVESLLDHAGLLKKPVSSFILQLSPKKNRYSAKELSDQERHQIRFRGLGFDQMDSFEDYLKWDYLP